MQIQRRELSNHTGQKVTKLTETVKGLGLPTANTFLALTGRWKPGELCAYQDSCTT